MSVILNFFVNNYIWFLVISFILIFALIGYFVDTKKDERFSKKIELDKELESKLEAAGAANITLNQMMKMPAGDGNTPGTPQPEKVEEVAAKEAEPVKDDEKKDSSK